MSEYTHYPINRGLSSQTYGRESGMLSALKSVALKAKKEIASRFFAPSEISAVSAKESEGTEVLYAEMMARRPVRRKCRDEADRAGDKLDAFIGPIRQRVMTAARRGYTPEA
jgi:hypothetical protein